MFFSTWTRDRELAAAVIVYRITKQRKYRKRNRRVWVKPWLTRRDTFGFHDGLMHELRQENTEEYPVGSKAIFSSDRVK